MSARYPSTLAPINHGMNTFPILLPILTNLFPSNGNILELSSGEGFHISKLSTHFPNLQFIASEADQFNLDRIQSSLTQANTTTVKSLQLDFTNPDHWFQLKSLLMNAPDAAKLSGIFGINFFHMISEESIQTIFSNLVYLSKPEAFIFIYGPFKSTNGFFTPSDASFDKMISERESEVGLGLRAIETVQELAKKEGWGLEERIELPKGNFGLVFRKEDKN